MTRRAKDPPASVAIASRTAAEPPEKNRARKKIALAVVPASEARRCSRWYRAALSSLATWRRSACVTALPCLQAGLDRVRPIPAAPRPDADAAIRGVHADRRPPVVDAAGDTQPCPLGRGDRKTVLHADAAVDRARVQGGVDGRRQIQPDAAVHRDDAHVAVDRCQAQDDTAVDGVRVDRPGDSLAGDAAIGRGRRQPPVDILEPDGAVLRPERHVEAWRDVDPELDLVPLPEAAARRLGGFELDGVGSDVFLDGQLLQQFLRRFVVAASDFPLRAHLDLRPGRREGLDRAINGRNLEASALRQGIAARPLVGRLPLDDIQGYTLLADLDVATGDECRREDENAEWASAHEGLYVRA